MTGKPRNIIAEELEHKISIRGEIILGGDGAKPFVVVQVDDMHVRLFAEEAELFAEALRLEAVRVQQAFSGIKTATPHTVEPRVPPQTEEHTP